MGCGKSRNVEYLEQPVGASNAKAWKDLEQGVPAQDDGLVPNDDLVKMLRGLLEEEISRGLTRSGISDRLERLERKEEMAEHRERAGLCGRLDRLERHVMASAGGLLLGEQIPPPPASPPPVLVSQPAASSAGLSVSPSCQGRGASHKAQPLQHPHMLDEFPAPGPPQPPTIEAEPPRRPEMLDAATLTDAESGSERSTPKGGGSSRRACRRKDTGCAPGASFGPTFRQMRQRDPPEKMAKEVEEDFSLRSSLHTLQLKLERRDSQTQELSRQLRECQKALWQQTMEARGASKRLRDVLGGSKTAEAEEFRQLQEQIKELSSRLADTSMREMSWEIIAKRQRAFFLQSERLASEGLTLLKRHPCGEVFIAPPPVCLDGEDPEELKKPPWDVGSSQMNPYVTDSWPFEPNSLAHRCASEPNLDRLDEASQEAYSDSYSEEEDTSGDHRRVIRRRHVARDDFSDEDSLQDAGLDPIHGEAVLHGERHYHMRGVETFQRSVAHPGVDGDDDQDSLEDLDARFAGDVQGLLGEDRGYTHRSSRSL